MPRSARPVKLTWFEHGIDSVNFSADQLRPLLRFTYSTLAEPTDKEAAKEEEKKKPEPWVITRLEFNEDAGRRAIPHGWIAVGNTCTRSTSNGESSTVAHLGKVQAAVRRWSSMADTRRRGWSEDFEKDYLRRVREWFDKYLK